MNLPNLRKPLLPNLVRVGAILILLSLIPTGFCAPATPPAQGSGMQLNISLGGAGAGPDSSMGLQLLLLFTVLSIAPSLIIMMTSFTRIVVVLSFLRSALGTQQPSNQIVIALSLFLTAFIMYPVWTRIDTDALTPLREKKIEMTVALERAAVPLKEFMLHHTRQKDVQLFSSMMPPTANPVVATGKPSDLPLQVVVPAFMISELRTAFQMGFVIFLPFLVIDMVVSSILMALGMFMLPPTMITLPTKILVFVLADGWSLIVKSLVQSFQ